MALHSGTRRPRNPAVGWLPAWYPGRLRECAFLFCDVLQIAPETVTSVDCTRLLPTPRLCVLARPVTAVISGVLISAIDSPNSVKCLGFSSHVAECNPSCVLAFYIARADGFSYPMGPTAVGVLTAVTAMAGELAS